MNDVKPFLEFDDIELAVKTVCEKTGASWNDLLFMNEPVAIRENVEPTMRKWFFNSDAAQQ